MKKVIILSIFLFTALSFVSAQNLVMTARGSAQGVIDGECIQKGNEKKIELLNYQYEVSTPRDAASGLASGKRTRSVFAITKKFDVSSLAFYKAWMNNEVLTNVTLEIFLPNLVGSNNGGQYILGLKIELMNVNVSSYKQVLADDNVPGNYPKPVDEIKFSYRTIRITHIQKNVTVEDNVPMQ